MSEKNNPSGDLVGALITIVATALAAGIKVVIDKGGKKITDTYSNHKQKKVELKNQNQISHKKK